MIEPRWKRSMDVGEVPLNFSCKNGLIHFMHKLCRIFKSRFHQIVSMELFKWKLWWKLPFNEKLFLNLKTHVISGLGRGGAPVLEPLPPNQFLEPKKHEKRQNFFFAPPARIWLEPPLNQKRTYATACNGYSGLLAMVSRLAITKSWFVM